MNLHERSETLAALAFALDDRRIHDRVTGPFDGRRVNALETPVRIYDLSEGGCFVTSLHDQQSDVQFVLQIELPYDGPVTLIAQTLYRKPGFGFAVRFVDVPDDAVARLRRTVERLKIRQPYDF